MNKPKKNSYFTHKIKNCQPQKHNHNNNNNQIYNILSSTHLIMTYQQETTFLTNDVTTVSSSSSTKDQEKQKQKNQVGLAAKVVVAILLLVVVGTAGRRRLNNNNNNNNNVATELVRGAASIRAATTTTGGSKSFLLWNPHYQNSRDFGPQVTGNIKDMLYTYNIDIGTLIMYTNLGATTTVGKNNVPWNDNRYKLIDIENRCPKDTLSIVYNSNRYQYTGKNKMGCFLNNNDRPYIVAELKELATGRKILAVGAHYQHDNGDSEKGVLKGAIAAMGGGQGRDKGVVFMSDTNWNNHYPTISEQHLGIGNFNSVQKTDNYKSCCTNNNFIYKFDTVISNIGSNGITKFPFGNNGMNSRPQWNKDRSQTQYEMHLPVVLTVQV